VPLRPAVFDRHVPAFVVAGPGKSSAERVDQVRIRAGQTAVEEPHDRQRLRLRTRDKRPSDRRAAKKREEISPLHVPPENKPRAMSKAWHVAARAASEHGHTAECRH